MAETSEANLGESGMEVGQTSSEHSQYYQAALNEVRKKHPEQETKIRDILENVDRQGVENIDIFSPSWDQDLHIPVTKVSVNEAVGLSASTQQQEKVVHIVFGGAAIPPAGHPFTPWDIVYDRVINYIPQAAHGKDIEIYSIAYPQGFGGKVSTKWLEAAHSSNAAYGRLYGEFVKGVMAQNPDNTRLILHGMSIGSTVAELAARDLSLDQRKKVQLLLDSPVGDHSGFLTTLLKALQIPAGFIGEAGLRLGFDEKIKASTGTEQPFLNRLKQTLSAKGINWEDDKAQTALKYLAAAVDISAVVKGSPLDTENIRSFVRKGIKDPQSFPSVGFFRSLVGEFKNELEVGNKISVTQDKRSLEFAINSTHFINRYRVDKWARIVSNFLPKQAPS